MAPEYKVRYIVTMEYTEERQESDRSFLVGVTYGRESEREHVRQEFWRQADPSTTGVWREACELLDRIIKDRS